MVLRHDGLFRCVEPSNCGVAFWDAGATEKDLLEFEQAPFLRQLATTTDIETSWLSGWFFGGLEHQTVHHLFPRIPRRNLHRTAAMVKYFCMRHGIRYNSMTFSQAIAKVIANLRAQSRVASRIKHRRIPTTNVFILP